MQNLFIEVTEDHFDSQIGDSNNLVFVAEIDIQGGAFTFIEQADTPLEYSADRLLYSTDSSIEFINLVEGMSIDDGGLEFKISNINTVTVDTPNSAHVMVVDGTIQSKITKQNFLKDSVNLATTIDSLGDSDFVSVLTNGTNKKITKQNLFNGFSGYTHPTYTARSINTTGAQIVDIFNSDSTGHVTNITTRTMTLGDLGYTGATNANFYVHPSFTTRNVTTSGAQVIGNIQSNSQGHINAITTRTMTLAELGYTGATDANRYTHPTYTVRNINTSAAQVLDIFASDATGHVTNITTRTMTLADLGYTGATNANNYSHPTYIPRLLDNQTGVSILSLLNVDSSGHITDLNTRELTLADLGYTGATNANNYSHPSYTSRSINTSGAQVIDLLTSDSTGHITNVTTRTMTAADIGALSTSGTAANSSQLGGVASSGWTRFNALGANTGYLHVQRSSGSLPALMVQQQAGGPIARFFNIATSGQTGSTSNQVEITNSGGIVADGNIQGHDTSDIRVKWDIKSIEDPLSAIKTFRTVEYYKQGKKEREVGLIAQDIIEQIPSVVKITKGHNLDDLLKIKQGGNELISYAFGAIKQLEERIVELESNRGIKGFFKRLRRK